MAADALVETGLPLSDLVAMMKRAIVQSAVIHHGSYGRAGKALKADRTTIYRVLTVYGFKLSGEPDA